MTKKELQDLLLSLNVPVTECVPEDDDINAETRICFWEYTWEDIVASGVEYNTKVTYQVSIIAEEPRCKILLKLKNKLNKLGIYPIINHEKNIEARRWHSYFSIEILENIGEVDE